jgi:hypothetical protein
VPSGRVPENVPHGVDALLTEYLYKTGDAAAFDLCKGL